MKDKVFVRSRYDLGIYSDNEKGGGEVVVDPSCYESTESIIAKLLSGQAVTGRYEPYYDVDLSTESLDEAFAKADITRQDGFELADVASIRAKEASTKASIELKKAENAKKRQNEYNEFIKAKKEAEKASAEAVKADKVEK